MKRLLHLFLLLALLSGCDKAVRNEATGYTQGTTYSVIYYTDGTDHQYQIDSLLLAFDRVLSTYQESSYISKWNRNEADDIAQPDMFKEVISQSIEIGNETNGAFDISVSPLMTYWFEQNWSSAEVDSARIDSILIHVGMHLVHFENGAFSKIDSLVELDVNAIAQGYSVDILSRYLEGQGVFNYLVEIGGEIRASGFKPDSEAWKVGIDKPVEENAEREIALTLELKNRSLATSGNYRKYVEIDGQKLGHTMNPKSGYPATTDVLSATVLAPSCMAADAYATVLLTMGFDKAKSFIAEKEELDAVLIWSDGNEVFVWMSKGLESS